MSFVLDRIGLSLGAEVVIADVSMSLEAGSMTVLLGPTLAGKTTLMRLMAGLDRPTHGRLIARGVDVTDWPVRRRSVAMVYQQFVNYPSLTVYENIASPLRVAGVAKAEIESRIAEAARLLRLDGLLHRLPAQLSGGQQQRTAIARALVKRADLVLLDEPLANLDYKLREELREELPRMFASTGAVLVYATTEPTEALLLGGSVATLSEGRMTQFGPTAQVYRNPANVDAARVFSDPPLNELSVRKRGSLVTLGDGRSVPALGPLSRLPDGSYRLGFRAEAVALDGAGLANLVFPGTVVVTEISGSESFVHVDTGLGVWVALLSGVWDWRPGAKVEVSVDLDRAFVFDEAGATALGAAAARETMRARA